MAVFSPSTWVLSNSTISSALSGIASIEQTSNGFKIITNDGREFEYVVQDMHEHTNLDTILNKFTLNANGDLLFNGKRLLDEDDLSDVDLEELKKLLQVITINTDGKAIINDVKIIVNPNTNKVNANGEDLLYVSDEASGDIDFDNDIIW